MVIQLSCKCAKHGDIAIVADAHEISAKEVIFYWSKMVNAGYIFLGTTIGFTEVF